MSHDVSTIRLDDEKLVTLQEICGVNQKRANELLEAGSGSVERAVAIHLGTSGGTSCVAVEDHDDDDDDDGEEEMTPPQDRCEKRQSANKDSSPVKKRARTAKQATPSKQSSLRSFFQSGTPKAETVASISKPMFETVDSSTVDPKTKSSAVSMMTSKGGEVVPPSISNSEDPRLLYRALAASFSTMVDTTKRLVKLDALREVLSSVIHAVGGIHSGDDRQRDAQILQYAVELILGTAGTTLQVSGSAVSKAVQTVTGASSGKLRDAYRKTGDLGDASEQFVRNQTLLVQPKPLTITVVHETLRKIASQEGKGSQKQRHTLMVKLLRSCKGNEMKFLVRTLLGNMRLGANMRTVLAALGHAVEEIDAERTRRSPDRARAAKSIQDTFDFCPRLDKVTLAILKGGISFMEQTCVLDVGTPVNPMLANAAHSLGEVKKLIEGDEDGNQAARTAVAEWKYDGVRCQAHYDGSRVTLYSRHMLDNTDQFPDVVAALLAARNPNVTSFIIDSEIVAVERFGQGESGYRLLPFQDLSTRRGSSEKGDGSGPVPVCIFAFDLLYVNGESLVKCPLYKRQAALKKYFSETTSNFFYAASITLRSYNESMISAFLADAVAGGAEGLMIKLTGEDDSKGMNGSDTNIPSCIYESGTRSQTWLKVKRDYVSGFADTIDVVPIGAWYGNGRKAQKQFLSPVLLAVYDDEVDVYRSISRCMSFTDAMYDATREFYFRGTPYPSNVGMDEIQTANDATVAQEDNANDDNDADVSCQEGSDSFQDDRVNCYPSKPSALVVTNENPPIWFKPSEVWEVSFADLTLSRNHTAAAGLVHDTRGVALRFPRFKRRRPDKRIDQATTCTQIAELFSKQSKQGVSKPAV